MLSAYSELVMLKWTETDLLNSDTAAVFVVLPSYPQYYRTNGI